MSLWAANGALKCWPCLTYTALAAWSKIRHYKDQEVNDIPQKIHLRVDWSRMFWRVEGRRPSDMIGVAERNQICPSSHYNSSLVILFSRSHSRKPCRLWAAEGVWLALSWLCKIQVHVSAIISCVELIKHYTNRTDSFLLLEGPMERHRNLTIYQKCEMRMVSRSARSVIVAGQLRKCEDPVILPLVASVVLCTDFWSHWKIFRLQTSV